MLATCAPKNFTMDLDCVSYHLLDDRQRIELAETVADIDW